MISVKSLRFSVSKYKKTQLAYGGGSMYLSKISFITLFVLLTTTVFAAEEFDYHYRFSAAAKPETHIKTIWGAWQTDLNSGSFGYTFSIEVPPGTVGLQPSLQLVYNSQAAQSKAGWTGAGWDLPIPYIQRDIEYSKTDPSDDTFDLHMDGKHDLVYQNFTSYKTKIDKYLSIETLNNGQNSKKMYWLVRGTDGTKYRFGYFNHSEQMQKNQDSRVDTQVYRWWLDTVTDVHGNTIHFTYSETDTATYISKIEYNRNKLRRVDFEWESNPSAYMTINQGSEEKFTQRLKSITVKVKNELVRRYDLAYTPNNIGSNSILKRITTVGSDGTSTLPPVKFGYKGMGLGFAPGTTWAYSGDEPIRETDDDSDTVKDLMDVNGDGLPDRVHHDKNTWKIRLNTSTGFSGEEKT
ncbi:MAG: hypothetical protein D3925_02270, partial [Candidatus Electrothrix sp. AR5]|nr:hypothetical protein [Candidatus Electrothrix sp. AR5]